jgi:hypothetical protein
MRPALIVPDDGWQQWAQWAAGMWSGICSHMWNQNGVRRRTGGDVCVSVVTDECRLQQLSVAPREHISILFSSEFPVDTTPSELTRSAWSMQNKLLDSFLDFMVRDSRPVCQIVIDSNNLLTRFELSYMWAHGALALGAFLAEDPLEMSGSDRWRRITAEALMYAESQQNS